MDRTGLTTEDHVAIWRRSRTGESMRSISRLIVSAVWISMSEKS